MHRTILVVALVALSIGNSAFADERGAAAPQTPDAVYGQGVRETPRLSPQDEAAGFHLPSGFVAELVASEPAIAKPLNIAFDPLGRLWITDTVEYPYPAATGSAAHDSIKILSDEDGNGTLETVTTFADGLNIPIGILPVADGVICFNIPNIMHLRDTDGDGKCDERKVLLGPFDTSRDTHGMINALRMGPDGWIYACHGFNNQSHVTASDGSSVHMISGNTFRFRADGSHVEQFTNGQVNPFGMTNDEFGNWFTADCHSKPVTMLVQGGYYESFGRPHDGIGFVPAVMDHLHGSTAICGISYYDAENFPKNFRRKFYSGNVMTSRINCNRFDVDRNRIRLVEEPDFMTSDDPWFRPVDIQLGPDGALYVADFYNKIIGHYEVRLDHPERDRTSGRIWKISYRGSEPTQLATKLPMQFSSADPTIAKKAGQAKQFVSPEASVNAAIQELSSTNATRRSLALSQLEQLRKIPGLESIVSPDTAVQGMNKDELAIARLWAMFRWNMVTPAVLETNVAQSAPPRLQVHALKVWASMPRANSADAAASGKLRQAARDALKSDVPQLSLAGAEALAVHGQGEDVHALLDEIATRPSESAIVPHAMRIAVKRLMQLESLAPAVLQSLDIKPNQKPATRQLTLANILPAVATPDAARALLSMATSDDAAVVALRAPALRLACKHMQADFAEPVMRLLNKLESGKDRPLSATLDEQTTLALEAYSTLRAGQHAVPDDLSRMLLARLDACAEAILAQLNAADASKPLVWQSSGNRAWQSEDRKSIKIDENIKAISSLTLGEAYTGTRSSEPFTCPESLTFWLCGHDGPPNVPPKGKNLVRLVQAETGNVLKQVAPPRHDRLHQVDWMLGEFAGQKVRFECVDGDDGNAYAWLAVANFSLPSLNPSNIEGGVARLAKLIEPMAKDGYDHLQSKLQSMLTSPALAEDTRARLISAVANARGRELGKLLADAALGRGLASAVLPALAIGSEQDYAAAAKTLGAAIAAQLTLSQQTQVARATIASSEGRALLVQLVEEGHMSPQCLRTIQDVLINPDSDPASKRLVELGQAAAAAPSEVEKAIVGRIALFKPAEGDYEKGRMIYEKNCQNCHKLRGVGQLVGPQLDGVGPRGAERLAEDILLPNRNVDKAFRMSSILTEDDRVLVGLVRESADGDVQLIGPDGKAQSIPKASIAQRKDTTRSLMPENFAELINDQDLSHLLRYLTQTK